MKQIISLLLLIIYLGSNAQCNESSLSIQQVRAQDTDSNIPWELAKHYTFFNPDCTSRNILVVHLVGSYDNPTNNTMFPSFAANNGFHAICLKYPNSTAAQTACGGSSATDCYNNFRKEIIEGGDYSPDIDVDITNSVNNRLLKLLQYLESNNPSENWDSYYSGNTIQWHKIIVSGHSQGGGHAAYIAKEHQVKRCLMFASPNDYSNFFSGPAPWLSNASSTPESAYFGFNNLHDDVVDFSDQFEIWDDLGIANFGDSLNVDLTTNYTSSHQLYTTITGINANDNHSLMIRDDQTPLDGFGKSVFEPVWEYMLDIDIGLTTPEAITINSLSIFPIPVKNTLHLNGLLNDDTVQIFNMQGELLVSKTIQDHTSTIDVSRIKPGVYILKITRHKKVIAKQFNKVH